MDSDAVLALGGLGIATTIFIIVVVIIGAIVYFIPSIVAYKKNRGNKVSILLLNIFLGWSLIGWVVSLVWAFKETPM